MLVLRQLVLLLELLHDAGNRCTFRKQVLSDTVFMGKDNGNYPLWPGYTGSCHADTRHPAHMAGVCHKEPAYTHICSGIGIYRIL